MPLEDCPSNEPSIAAGDSPVKLSGRALGQTRWPRAGVVNIRRGARENWTPQSTSHTAAKIGGEGRPPAVR
jgi:hypothetical protein